MSTTTWPVLAAALPYGFRPLYVFKVEGLQYAFTEQDISATNPTGYSQQPVLVVEDSAKIGSVVDRKEGIGRGFDLTVTLQRNATTTTLFARPSKITRLMTTLDYNETGEVEVESTTGWASSGTIDIGNERIGYSYLGTGANGHPAFMGLTRGSPNGDWKGYDHPASSQVSTWVTDQPLFWKGRKARLYAAPVDPFGAVVGSDLLDEGVLIWEGSISTAPRPTAEGWQLQCRSMDRILTDEIGSSVTGSGIWELVADPLVTVDPDWRIRCEVTYNPGYPWGPDQTFDLQPFDGYSAGDKVRLSQLRDDFVVEWDAVVATLNSGTGDSHIGNGKWTAIDPLVEAGTGITRRWVFQFAGSSHTSNASLTVYTDVFLMAGYMPAFPLYGLGAPYFGTTFNVPNPTDTTDVHLTMGAVADAQISTLNVTVDKGDPSDIAAAGFITVEAGEATTVYEYDGITTNGAQVEVQLVEGSGPTLASLDEASLNQTTLTVAFALRDSGPYADMMRRMLLSSGRGDNDGTYDTLPLAGGYDLAEVDTASFDTVLDGAWPLLQGDILLDEQVSWADLYGSVLALSGRALVPRKTAPGVIQLGVVRTTLHDTAEAPTTITDAHLIHDGTRSPVRLVRQRDGSNRVEATLKEVAGKSDGRVVVRDVVAERAEATSKWAVDLYGVPRDTALVPIRTWARSHFADRHDSMIYEFDTVPWGQAQTGDAILIDSTHPALWDRATGAAGYTGPGRVLGVQVDLKTARMTLTVALQGTYRGLTLAPSMPVASWTGTATVPTTITITGTDYLDLCNAYLASSDPFRLVVYKPSEDTDATYYDIGGVTQSGSDTVLTVDTVTGSHTLTTDSQLTIASSADANEAQARHMHTDTDGGVWR